MVARIKNRKAKKIWKTRKRSKKDEPNLREPFTNPNRYELG